MSNALTGVSDRFPADWNTFTVGEAFEMQLGKMLSKAFKLGKSPKPYLANKNVQWDRVDLGDLETMDFTESEQDKFSLLPGDLLVCEGGEIGRTAMWRGEVSDCYFQKAIHRLRPRSNFVLPEYMLRYMRLSATNGWLVDFMSQSSIAHLTREQFARVPICVPTPPQQRKIARILTTVDNLIEKTEALIAKYQAIKQGMMHDLFTRGVDEHGHLRPSCDEAPDLYKHSELGWIPKEWWIATIGELFDKRTEHGREGLPVMSIVMRDGLVERSSVDRRVESNLSPQGHALVLRDDITYNMMRMWQGVLGRAAFDCLVSPAYVVLKPKEYINTRFAAFLFSDERSIQKFRQFSQGVVDDRLRLYFHDLVDIPFAVPTSLEEQETIARRIEACNNHIAKEKVALERFHQLHLGLMQDLLTGKVRVTVDEAEEVAASA